MRDFLENEDLELWDIVERGPKDLMAKDNKDKFIGLKSREKYNNEDIKFV